MARKRKTRRDQRGAAMVESLVAIPFFGLMFVCSIYVGNLYREKLRVIREAKECAWTSASKGDCEGGCANAQVQSAGNDDLDQGAEGAHPIQGAPGTDILTKGFKEASATVTGKTVERQDLFNAGTNAQTPAWRSVVMCNEKPEVPVTEDGYFPPDFIYAYGQLTGW